MKKIIVLKCGGSILNELSLEFFQNLHHIQTEGYQIIIVHGGGPEINSMLEKLHIESVFINGQRQTTKQVLEVAEMMLSAKNNKALVNTLQRNGVKAIGLSGCDGELLKANFINKDTLGYVGQITAVNTKLLSTLCEQGYVPVISPISVTENFEKINVNADGAAAAIAKEMQAEKLLFVTDVPGILIDKELLKQTNPEQLEALIENGTIYGGMIPKTKAAIESLSQSLKEVMIVSGKQSFLDESEFIGTTITLKPEVSTL